MVDRPPPVDTPAPGAPTVVVEMAVSPERLAVVLGEREVWIRAAVALGARVDAHPAATGPVADGDLLRLRRGGRRGSPGPGSLIGDRSLILQARRADPVQVPDWTVLAGPGPVTGLTVELTELAPAADVGDGRRRTLVTVRWQLRARQPVRRPSGRTIRALSAAGRLLVGIVEATARAPRVVVAAAILRRVGEQTELLLARCRTGEWELPGGKVEPRESEHEALRREIVEELGVQVTAGRRLGAPVDLGDGLELRCLTATVDPGQGPARATEHTELRWVTVDGLDEVLLRSADEAWREDLRAVLRARPATRQDGG